MKKMVFFDTKKQPERNLSVMETRANQIIAEAGDNINNDIASAKFKGLTPSQIVIAKILARNVALSEAILQKLSK